MKENSTIIERTQEVVAWYQTKIGNYDKQLWEQSVEQRILKGLENRPKKKEGSLNKGLIDVDLVRGSAFTKAKPQHHWSAALRKGIQRVILFPCYLSWWRHHTSPRITKILGFIYLMQVAQLAIVGLYDNVLKEVHLAEVLIPFGLLIFLGVLHSQIVSTYGTKKCAAPPLPSSRVIHGTSGSTSTAPVPGQRHGRSGVSRSSKVKKSRVRASQNRSKSTVVSSPSTLSPGESGPFDGETTGAEAEKLAEFINAKNKPVPDPVVWQNGVSPSLHASAGTAGPARRRHRSWRVNNDCRDSPIRSVHSAVTGGSKSSTGTPSPARRGVEVESLSSQPPVVRADKFYVQTVPSDEERRLPDSLLDADSGADDEYGSSGPCQLLTGHSDDLNSRSGLVLPDSPDGELIFPADGANFEPTASPVDSAFAESDAAKKSGSGSSTRPSSASSGQQRSRAESLSASSSTGERLEETERPTVRMAGDEVTVVVTTQPEETACEEGEDTVAGNPFPFVTVTPVSEESDNRGQTEERRRTSEERSLRLRRPDKLFRSRSASPTPATGEENHLNANLPGGSCHESSNDDTYTSMSKRRVEFAQLFRRRSGRRPRRSTTSMTGAVDGEDEDGFEQGLADESSDPEEDERPEKAAAGAAEAAAAAVGSGGGGSAGSNNSPTSGGRFVCDAERSPTHKGLNVGGSVQSTSGSKPKMARPIMTTRNSKTITSQASETEYDRINSDVGSSDSTSESQDSENGLTNSTNEISAGAEDPFVLWFRESQPKQQHKINRKDTISCYVWEGEELKKSDLTLLDIGWSIIQAVERYPTERHYIRYAIIMAALLSLGPLLFRFYLRRDILWQLPHANLDIPVPQLVIAYMPSLFGHILFGRQWFSTFAVLLGVGLRCCLYVMLFFLLCVAERTYAQRLQYAKHFCYLTSSRRARKYYLPHFRLNKVSNIKSWLSLRSYLKKRGPQRSVDCIITSCIYIMLTVLSILCVHLLQDSYHFLNHLINWDLLLVALALGLFLLRFMTLGTKITKKFRNLSVLITEQINLYLSMEKKPHKKDELMLAKNVLKLAEELLKELDGPFRICGWSMNPLVYNILKVVILSAFSAVLTEMLGFKLKLYKIKLNPINW